MGGLGPATKRLEQAVHREKDSKAILRSTGPTVQCPGCEVRYQEQRVLEHLEGAHRDLYWRLVSEAKDSGVIPPDDGNLLRYIKGRRRKTVRNRASPQKRRLDA